jgi:hypothetical protein
MKNGYVKIKRDSPDQGRLTISVKELEKACSLILDYLRQTKGEEVTFENDWYWTVKQEDKYRICQEEPCLLIGSVSDDIKVIGKLVERQGECSLTALDLELLGEIFVELSENDG